nr:T9SS type A sorting domain-containing protein [Saprospiraceae bacterium]
YTNCHLIKQDYPAIDLHSENIAFQVSAQDNAKKIKDSINLFKKKIDAEEYDRTYKRINILIISIMKTFKYFLAYPILIFCYSTIYAQQNLPLKFQNEAVKWSELNWIEGNRKEDQIFQNRVPPIFIADTIYFFTNYCGVLESGISVGYSGYNIKKINKKTGEKYWEVLRTYKSFFNRKAISQPLLNKNKLAVTLYDEATDSGSTDWYNCYPSHIIIDTQNGSIIDSNYIDSSNNALPKFQSIAGSQGQSIITNPRFYFTDTGYLQRELSTGELAIIDTKTDFKGVVTQRDTAKLTFKYFPEDFRFFDNTDGTLGALSISQSNNWDNREIKYLMYDKNLKLLKSIDLSNYFTDTITLLGLYRADQDYIITVTTFDDFATRIANYTYQLFDKYGNLVDKLIYYLRDGIDNGIEYGWLYPLTDVVNKRLLLTQSRQNKIAESTFYEIFASNGDSIQRIKRIEVDGISDHFRTQFATMMKDGDILLYIEQFAKNDPGAPRWYNWTMFDGQEMNIINSTKDEQANSRKLKLYPNPTSGTITINGLEGEANVSIRNINSQILIKSKTISNQIDISVLRAGMYIIEIENGNLREWHKVVKK